MPCGLRQPPHVLPLARHERFDRWTILGHETRIDPKVGLEFLIWASNGHSLALLVTVPLPYTLSFLLFSIRKVALKFSSLLEN